MNICDDPIFLMHLLYSYFTLNPFGVQYTVFISCPGLHPKLFVFNPFGITLSDSEKKSLHFKDSKVPQRGI